MEETKFLYTEYLTRSNYYDIDGNPISLEEWSKDIENFKKKTIASDHIEHMHVSTVWLGIDHDFFRRGKPIIFETMIFDSTDDEDYQERYCTKEEALEGHKRAIKYAKGLINEKQ